MNNRSFTDAFSIWGTNRILRDSEGNLMTESTHPQAITKIGNSYKYIDPNGSVIELVKYSPVNPNIVNKLKPTHRKMVVKATGKTLVDSNNQTVLLNDQRVLVNPAGQYFFIDYTSNEMIEVMRYNTHLKKRKRDAVKSSIAEGKLKKILTDYTKKYPPSIDTPHHSNIDVGENPISNSVIVGNAFVEPNTSLFILADVASGDIVEQEGQNTKSKMQVSHLIAPVSNDELPSGQWFFKKKKTTTQEALKENEQKYHAKKT